MKIEIVSGSSRQESITLRAAKHLQGHLNKMAPQHTTGLIDLRAYPIGFIDAVYSTPEQAPENLFEVATRMFEADAFIIVTPEYNGAMAPSLVNWFGHFPKQLHKAFGLVSASNGALGGLRSAMQMQHFALALYGIPSPQMLVIGQVDKKFDVEGNLLAEIFQNNIDTFTTEFLWLAEKLKS